MLCRALLLAIFLPISISGGYHAAKDKSLTIILNSFKSSFSDLSQTTASLLRHRCKRIKEKSIIFTCNSSQSFTYAEKICLQHPDYFSCNNIGICNELQAPSNWLGHDMSEVFIYLSSSTIVTSNWQIEMLKKYLYSDSSLISPMTNLLEINTDTCCTHQTYRNTSLPPGHDIDSFSSVIHRLVSSLQLDDVSQPFFLPFLRTDCILFSRGVLLTHPHFLQALFHAKNNILRLSDINLSVDLLTGESAARPTRGANTGKGHSKDADTDTDTESLPPRSPVLHLEIAFTSYVHVLVDDSKGYNGGRESRVVGRRAVASESQALSCGGREGAKTCLSGHALVEARVGKVTHLFARLNTILEESIERHSSYLPLVRKSYAASPPPRTLTPGHTSPSPPPSMPMRVLFVVKDILPSGGVISIVQEVLQMRSYGVEASLAVGVSPSRRGEVLRLVQDMFPTTPPALIARTLVTYSGHCCFPHTPSEELIALAATFDIVVATYYTTMYAVSHIVAVHKHVLAAYYVQDVETWFSCKTFSCVQKCVKDLQCPVIGSQYHKYAVHSYIANNQQTILFAKSEWIRDTISASYGIPSKVQVYSQLASGLKSMRPPHVHKVEPSVDKLLYYPDRCFINTKTHLLAVHASSATAPPPKRRPFRVIAMIRPATPRRNAIATLDLLLLLAHRHPTEVAITIFGVTSEDIEEVFHSLVQAQGHASHRDWRLLLRRPQWEMLGVVRGRGALADLYRRSDLFVDMSWWQAFGRSAVEAMACGCIAVFPKLGNGKYICGPDNQYCIAHDSDDVSGLYAVIAGVMRNGTLHAQYIQKSLQRVESYSVTAAAVSILEILHTSLNAFRNRSTNMSISLDNKCGDCVVPHPWYATRVGALFDWLFTRLRWR